MLDLTDIKHVKSLQANLRALFGSPHGQDILKFMEAFCGWYDFNETDKDKILIAHGKRQVLASIKSLIDLTPEQIRELAREKEF